MLDKKVIFCATISNEEKNLKNFFNLVNKISSLFKEYYLIIIESDSSDKSLSIISHEMKKRNGEFKSLGNLKNKYFERTKRLEICRNEYLKIINEDKGLKGYDYMIVLDADRVNDLLDPNSLKESILNLNNQNWSSLFPNQSYLYYDIWALRVENFIENDCFDEFYKLVKKYSFKKSYYISVTKKMFFLKNNKDRYKKVISAFGGLGIYKIERILGFFYDSKEGSESEHVSFNEKIDIKYGNNLIDTKLINSRGLNSHTINSVIFMFSNFFAKKFYLKMFKKK